MISPRRRSIFISTDPGSKRELTAGRHLHGAVAAVPVGRRRGRQPLVFMPGGAVPGIGVQLANQHGGRRIVRLDPMTGFPRVESVDSKVTARKRGFTLLEMMVATTIMAVAMVGLLSGIAGATRNAARLRDYDRAAQLARLRMNELLADDRMPRDSRIERHLRPSLDRRHGGRLAGAADHRRNAAHSRAPASRRSTASSWRSGGWPGEPAAHLYAGCLPHRAISAGPGDSMRRAADGRRHP